MIGLIQRVTSAKVRVSGEVVAHIGTGMLVLVGMQRGDGEKQANRLLERLLSYRIFPDCNDKMNNSLRDIGGDLLLVPQFTLAADTDKGNRPSFTPALPPQEAAVLFDYLFKVAVKKYPKVEIGVFGADMQVSLTNDGPVTFWLKVSPSLPPSA